MIRRLAWPIVAAIAFAFLVGLALHGERPEPGLVSFKAAGFLKQFAPNAAIEVDVSRQTKHKLFRRDADWPPRIDEALRLLRDSAPLRTMTAEETATEPPSSYGLDDKAMTVVVRSAAGETFAIHFGSSNPLGSGRYAAVDGVEGVPILPAYVADAWEQILK
jgi:hypothetical protein